MPKRQQSASKEAYRSFVTFTSLLLKLYISRRVRTAEDAENRLSEATYEMSYKQDEVMAQIEFSRSPNPALWNNRLRERIDYIRDKLIEDAYDQLDRDTTDEDEQLEQDAAAFGTDVDTWLDFLATGIGWTISKQSQDKERARSYAFLEDVINDWEKLAAFVRYVRYDGKRYFVSVQGSDHGARARRGGGYTSAA